MNHSSVYQINTRVWLGELSHKLGRPASFQDISDESLDRIRHFGFDWIWFLGVWQTCEAGKQLCRANEEWRNEFTESLPDFTEEDICGSPFAIESYTPHEDFGTADSLRELKQRMNSRGLKLLLDFVPNHTALDHPWVEDHLDYYIRGSESDFANTPKNFVQRQTAEGTVYLAHGRDPYFPAWPDTLQLNFRHTGLRTAMLAELENVTQFCDGVRCDMAMLLLPDVIAWTWGGLSLPADGSAPVDDCFWPEAVQSVHHLVPDFTFVAEVYWGLEPRLLEQGFDFTYDKTFYDHLVKRDAPGARAHLEASTAIQSRQVHFLENHDEQRAAAVFNLEEHQAAAIATFFLPGMRLFHEGQIKGRQTRTSMHLARRPEEPTDAALMSFYIRLLEVLARPEMKEGACSRLSVRAAWEENPSCGNFLATFWMGPEGERLIAVANFSSSPSQCYLEIPADSFEEEQYLFSDAFQSLSFLRKREELQEEGIYLDLPGWGFHILDIHPVSEEGELVQ